MADIHELLQRFKIKGADPHRQGRQYTLCPVCSDDRHGANRNSKCLGLNIDSQGIQFFCNHCEHNDGAFFEESRVFTPQPRRNTSRAYPPRPSLTGYGALQRTARVGWRA